MIAVFMAQSTFSQFSVVFSLIADIVFGSTSCTSAGTPACAGASQSTIWPWWHGDWQVWPRAGLENSFPNSTLVYTGSQTYTMVGVFIPQKLANTTFRNLPHPITRADLPVPTTWSGTTPSTAKKQGSKVKDTVYRAQLSNLDLKVSFCAALDLMQ